MKVWLVLDADYGDVRIVGVYESEEAALTVARTIDADCPGSCVDEYEVEGAPEVVTRYTASAVGGQWLRWHYEEGECVAASMEPVTHRVTSSLSLAGDVPEGPTVHYWNPWGIGLTLVSVTGADPDAVFTAYLEALPAAERHFSDALMARRAREQRRRSA